MTELIMEVNREGYSTDQIDRTMTVGELIDFLSQFDEDTPIYTSHDNGYTYGGISTLDFGERETEDDCE